MIKPHDRWWFQALSSGHKSKHIDLHKNLTHRFRGISGPRSLLLASKSGLPDPTGPATRTPSPSAAITPSWHMEIANKTRKINDFMVEDADINDVLALASDELISMFVCYEHCRDHWFDLLTQTCTIIDLLGFAFALNFNAGIDISEPLGRIAEWNVILSTEHSHLMEYFVIRPCG